MRLWSCCGLCIAGSHETFHNFKTLRKLHHGPIVAFYGNFWPPKTSQYLYGAKWRQSLPVALEVNVYQWNWVVTEWDNYWLGGSNITQSIVKRVFLWWFVIFLWFWIVWQSIESFKNTKKTKNHPPIHKIQLSIHKWKVKVL